MRNSSVSASDLSVVEPALIKFCVDRGIPAVRHQQRRSHHVRFPTSTALAATHPLLHSYDEMLQIVQSIYDMTGEMVKLPLDEDTAQKVSEHPFPLPRDSR